VEISDARMKMDRGGCNIFGAQPGSKHSDPEGTKLNNNWG
jgi:hypothetical protein